MLICYDEVVDLFNIDMSSPSGLSWKRKPSKFANDIVGKPAGKLTKDGYYQVPLGGVHVHNHRILFVLYTGEDLSDGYQIDHADGNRENLEETNLRKCSHSENSQNAKTRVDNKLGIKNVYQEKGGTFCVSVQKDGKRESVYGVKTLEEAKLLAKSMRSRLHLSFNVDER